MNKTIQIALAALAFTTLAVAQDVTYNYDTSTDFAKFKSYKWVDMPGGTKLDELITRQLTSALQAELAKKGLVKTDSDQADLYIGYQAAVGQEREITAYTGWGAGPRWRGTGIGTATTATLLVGSMAVSVYDPANKRLIWLGTVSKTLESGVTPEKRQKNIEKAITRLMKYYPPRKK
jgi:hypothetical protein